MTARVSRTRQGRENIHYEQEHIKEYGVHNICHDLKSGPSQNKGKLSFVHAMRDNFVYSNTTMHFFSPLVLFLGRHISVNLCRALSSVRAFRPVPQGTTAARPNMTFLKSLAYKGRYALASLLLAGAISTPLSPAQAQCFECSCHDSETTVILEAITDQYTMTGGEIAMNTEIAFIDGVIDQYFRLYVLNSVMSLVQELSAVAMLQTSIIGQFFDAKQQMEVQRHFEVLRAETQSRYQPSMQLCSFGSIIRPVSASASRSKLVASVIAQRAIDRQLHSNNSNASHGPQEDHEGRFKLFLNYYCNFNDFNTNFHSLCQDKSRHNFTVNADIDFNRIVRGFGTLRDDIIERKSPLYSDPRSFWEALFNFEAVENITEAPAIFEMASNLYGHTISYPFSEFEMLNESNHSRYYDIRAIAARRSIAVNSFAAIASMNTQGALTGALFPLEKVMRQMGLETPDGDALTQDIDFTVGTRPSYNILMDFLTKRLYQNPSFYTNLYDTPENNARKQTTMRAISTMQNFDMLKSRLRNEAALSALIDLELAPAEIDVTNRMGSPVQEGYVD
jgi:hypothetical protein